MPMFLILSFMGRFVDSCMNHSMIETPIFVVQIVLNNGLITKILKSICFITYH